MKVVRTDIGRVVAIGRDGDERGEKDATRTSFLEEEGVRDLLS